MSTGTAIRPPQGRIDPRLRDRRVTVMREQGRRRLRRLGYVAFGVVIVIIVAFVLSSPLLDVDDVTVRGVVHTSTSDVSTAAQLGGCAVAWCDTDAAARRVEQLPWVLDARVETSWPNQARIDLTERIAAGFVALAPDRVAQVDGTGRVLAIGAPTLESAHIELEGLASLAAPGEKVSPVAPAVVAAALTPPLRDRVAVVIAEPLRLVLVDGSAVRLGDTEALPEKLAAASAVLDQLGGARVAYVDVRVPSAPAVGPRR